jgi:hypothetical protein
LHEGITSLCKYGTVLKQVLTLHYEGWREAVAFEQMITKAIGFGDMRIVAQIKMALSFAMWIVETALLGLFEELINE